MARFGVYSVKYTNTNLRYYFYRYSYKSLKYYLHSFRTKVLLPVKIPIG